MPPSFTPEPVEIDGDPPVRGVLHRASGEAPDTLVLTHGAGSDHRAARARPRRATPSATAGVSPSPSPRPGS